jgi:periplasmic protein TonB
MTIPFVEDRSELLRWALSGAAVVFLHGAVAAAMVNWNDESTLAPTAALVVDLSPFPTAPPEHMSALPPGPPQNEADESQYQKPVTEAKEQVEEATETSQSQEVQPELAQAVNPEVALDTTPPKPEQKVEIQQENQTARDAMAPPEMPQFEVAEVAAAQVQGAPTVDRSNAISTWRSSISELLERNKRYPADAKSDRGIAQIAFSIDRKGHVMSSRIVKTSGSAALDREALEMVKRSQPFPPPPAALTGTEVSLTVPVRFNMR